MSFVQPVRDIKTVRAFVKAAWNDSSRNGMLVDAGFNTGLRISDLLVLRVRDVQGEFLIIIEKKTGKRQRLQLNPKLQKLFRRYTKGKDGRVYLFRSRQGTNKPLTRSAAYKMLRKIAEQVGVAELGTHSLRKTFGYHLYRKTKDVALLQYIFNHAKPSTTLRYIGITQDAVDEEMRAFSL